MEREVERGVVTGGLDVTLMNLVYILNTIGSHLGVLDRKNLLIEMSLGVKGMYK